MNEPSIAHLASSNDLETGASSTQQKSSSTLKKSVFSRIPQRHAIPLESDAVTSFDPHTLATDPLFKIARRSLNTSQIGSIFIGAILGLALIVVLAMWVVSRRRNGATDSPKENTKEDIEKPRETIIERIGNTWAMTRRPAAKKIRRVYTEPIADPPPPAPPPVAQTRTPARAQAGRTRNPDPTPPAPPPQLASQTKAQASRSRPKGTG